MLEKEIEKLLVKEIEKLGGICWKFTSPGTVGVPDRIALLKEGRIAFVECKAPGQSLRPIQIKRKRQLEELGFKVYVLDSKERVKEVIHEIQSI